MESLAVGPQDGDNSNHRPNATCKPFEPKHCSSGLLRPDTSAQAGPCPAALYLGLERGAVTRNQLDVPQFRRFCRALIEHYVDLLQMLAREGARLRIVGVAGCPSCGVTTTSSGYTGGRVRETDCTPGFRKFNLMAVIDLHTILG